MKMSAPTLSRNKWQHDNIARDVEWGKPADRETQLQHVRGTGDPLISAAEMTV